jgi:hypothetical protein
MEVVIDTKVRTKLAKELEERDVVKTERWWSFPVKAGEEYTF